MVVFKAFVLEPIVFQNFERIGIVEPSSLVAGHMEHAVQSRITPLSVFYWDCDVPLHRRINHHIIW